MQSLLYLFIGWNRRIKIGATFFSPLLPQARVYAQSIFMHFSGHEHNAKFHVGARTITAIRETNSLAASNVIQASKASHLDTLYLLSTVCIRPVTLQGTHTDAFASIKTRVNVVYQCNLGQPFAPHRRPASPSPLVGATFLGIRRPWETRLSPSCSARLLRFPVSRCRVADESQEECAVDRSRPPYLVVHVVEFIPGTPRVAFDDPRVRRLGRCSPLRIRCLSQVRLERRRAS